MKDNQTIAQFLGLTVLNGKPFKIKNEQGKIVYVEYCNGIWDKYKYDERGNYYFYENSGGRWNKREYNDKNEVIYIEESCGYIWDNRPKPKIELTMKEIADKLGIPVEQLKIKE